jgi:hypothetical protein
MEMNMKNFAAVFFCLSIVASIGSVRASAEEKKPPLKVTAVRGVGKDGPTVILTVVNVSDTYQIYQSISCSWQQFWQTDVRNVIVVGQSECAKNSFFTLILAPGEKHVERSSLLLFRGNPGARKIRFGYSRRPSDFTGAELKRIASTNEKYTYFSRADIASRFKAGKETFWSAPLTIEFSKPAIAP